MFDFFFFFQAEDGIRDRDVTGVQTCALPISSSGVARFLRRTPKSAVIPHQRAKTIAASCGWLPMSLQADRQERSEERRVGKECRCRWVGEVERERKELSR